MSAATAYTVAAPQVDDLSVQSASSFDGIAPTAAAPFDAQSTIIASRYKTKWCRTQQEKGECPYESRCMFAHSEEELRTKEQNIADGLTTEEAIKSHRRAISEAERMRQKRKYKKKERKMRQKLEKQMLRAKEAGIATPPQQESNSSCPDSPGLSSFNTQASGAEYNVNYNYSNSYELDQPEFDQDAATAAYNYYPQQQQYHQGSWKYNVTGAILGAGKDAFCPEQVWTHNPYAPVAYNPVCRCEKCASVMV